VEKGAERITRFYSPTFITHFPDTAKLSPYPYLVPTLFSQVQAFLHAEYPYLIRALRSGTITCADIILVHHLVFDKQMPDQVYQVVDRLKPELLDMHRELSDLMDKEVRPGSLHLLHALNYKGIMRVNQGKRRRLEYGATPPAIPKRDSVAKHVVIHAPQGLAQWLIGEVTHAHTNGDSTPGLYHTNQSTTPVVDSNCLYTVTYYAAYTYYRRTTPARLAKKLAMQHQHNRIGNTGCGRLGLHELIAPDLKTKHRKRAFGQQRAEKYRAPAATVGIPVSFQDENFASRMRRLDVLDKLRQADVYTISAHLNSIQTQERISVLLRQLQQHLTARDHKNVAATVLLLYPDVDEELAARARVSPPLLGQYLTSDAAQELIPNIMTVARHSGGLGFSSFAGLCTAMILYDDSAVLIPSLALAGWFAQGGLHAAKICKAMHNYARRLQRLPKCMENMRTMGGHRLVEADFISLDALLYVGNLLGRGQDTLTADDGDDAERARHVPDHLLIENDPRPEIQLKTWRERTDRVYATYTTAVSQALARHHEYTPEDFLAAFIQLAPKGSVGEGKNDLKAIFGDIVNTNKRLWLDSIPTSRVVSAIQEEAIQKIKAQIKTESGFKMRQIYPGAIIHWLNESVASVHSEEAIFDSSIELQLGNDSWQNLADIRRRMDRWKNRVCTVASDYANFNILHTVMDMARFWARVIAQPTSDYKEEKGEWNGSSYRAHLHKVATWLIASLDRMYILPVVGRKGYLHVVRGLMSGWRTTSFINNAKNHVYSTALNESCHQLIGRKPLVFQRKNGDDEDAESFDIFSGLTFLMQMSRANLDIQPGKQLVGYDASEFLRIFTYKGKMYGNRNRAVGGFVSADLQHPVVDAGLDYVKGTSQALHMLARRGANLEHLEEIRDITLMAYAHISYRDEKGDQHNTQLSNPAHLYVDEASGGFGCTRYGRIENMIPASRRKWPNARAQWTLDGAPHYGVTAMYNKIQRKFHEAGLSLEPLRRVRSDIIDIAVHGIDTKANQAEEDYARRLSADHIAWLNKTPQPKKQAAVDVLNARGAEVADHAYNHIMYCPAEEVTRSRIPDPQEEMEGMVGRILGLASVSPSLIHQLYDVKTNRKVPYTEVYERLQTTGPRSGTLLEHWPSPVLEMVNHRDLEWSKETYGVCPAELQPALLYIQKHVIRACFSSTNQPQRDIAMIRHLLQATANHFAKRMLKEHSATMMF